MKLGLALGSNLGDRLQSLRQAKSFLTGLSRNGVCLASPVYETEPVDCPAGSPAFYNAVIEIDYEGRPQELLAKTQAYEKAAGRDRDSGRNAARTIDIDLLYADALEIHEPGFDLPHPRLTGRRFVLLPLSMIRPALIVPGQGQTVAALLDELPKEGPRVTLVRNDW